MKSQLAILGGEPAFASPVPVGQLYFPSWERYEAAMRGIFERQYYNNNGPLLTELESRLQEFLGVKHVLCVTNATLGLMIAADALQLTGKVILPSFTFIASAQSMSWAGLQPVFCDVDPQTHQIDIGKLDSLIDRDVSAIMGVNLWGGSCNPKALETYARSKGLKLIFDSAHAFGCEIGEKKIGQFGDVEVFSFHATKILSATEGGCITTQDDALADRIRAIRPSYGPGKGVPIVRVANSRMSEAQAAVALMSLEDFPANRRKNEELYGEYANNLETVPGLRLVKPSGVTLSNYQYIVFELDERSFGLSRDELIQVLQSDKVQARRYFYPGIHRTIEYKDQVHGELPVTDSLTERCFQLPIGAMVDAATVRKICSIVKAAHEHANEIRALKAQA